MGIDLKTHKILWGRSGNRCAICQHELILDSADPQDDPSIVGDEAHIIARKKTFTRGDYDSLTEDERDHYSNLILLCKLHHKQIDDQPNYYTVERLREIKQKHEENIRAKRSDDEERALRDDLVYAGYVDHWAKLAALDNWRDTCSFLSANTPTLPKQWYDSQKDILVWIIGRIWPQRHPSLEKAMLNYKAVVQDLLNVFDRHVDPDSWDTKYIRTEKFYKIREWNRDLYRSLLDQYNAHDCLINDLFFELTRAANYVCDRVRETIFDGYRFAEGALLIERHCVGFDLKTVHVRVEYRGDERSETPYPGLAQFKEVRYTRDYALDPDPPGPPTLDENA